MAASRRVQGKLLKIFVKGDEEKAALECTEVQRRLSALEPIIRKREPRYSESGEHEGIDLELLVQAEAQKLVMANSPQRRTPPHRASAGRLLPFGVNPRASVESSESHTEEDRSPLATFSTASEMRTPPCLTSDLDLSDSEDDSVSAPWTEDSATIFELRDRKDPELDLSKLSFESKPA
eukprot:CAMPEP_0175837676 /NCGR_PEP_ID=MMETSP0107_2-20121207/17823_1 /TAXON_ID=195067 ORGANISM="Goniomonas pacifica, Strain CCMP1869" /NCGR_SAMPLE_ID=MMETSP0107_2 /ASSEMBLY_ACC=CAM_ASM_000203 /LENGTH=178 /DNA_ID=CAMNT_0017151193 /DNA_START=16 /DNA_END=552 /DNA_ORIENTATION=-